MKIKFNTKNINKISDIDYNKFYQSKKKLAKQTEPHDCLILAVGDYIIYFSDDGSIEYDQRGRASTNGPLSFVDDKVTITIT